MTKNIIIGVLVFISAFLVVYANIKAKDAEKQTIMAQLNLELAKENEAEAREQERRAVEAAARALIEQRKAEELQIQLDECKK